MAQFDLGQLVMTRGIADLVEENAGFAKHVMRALQRYTSCDWGDLCEEDAQMNDSAIGPDGGRILAAYEHPEHSDWRLWVVTEWDRSVTTLLFPHEY